MRRAALAALAPFFIAAAAQAQTPDPHAGHHMTPPPTAQAPTPDPHAGHAMPAETPAPLAEAHAGHEAAPPPEEANAPPPPIPTDHAADRVYGPGAMAASRETLRHEHGDIRWSMLLVETAEYRSAAHGDGYRWRARASTGDDVNRFVLRTEGEGAAGDLEHAEVQALWSRAIGPTFNLEAGVRQDFEPRSRTYATVGVEGLAPYWIDVQAALFLSDRGDLTGRVEASTDWRLTQRLILEPRGELNFAAQDVPALRLGSGITDLEVGLRLRYAIRPEFAPYVGVNWERSFGGAADFARAAGRDVEQTRFVVGVRAWF